MQSLSDSDRCPSNYYKTLHRHTTYTRLNSGTLLQEMIHHPLMDRGRISALPHTSTRTASEILTLSILW